MAAGSTRAGRYTSKLSTNIENEPASADRRSSASVIVTRELASDSVIAGLLGIASRAQHGTVGEWAHGAFVDREPTRLRVVAGGLGLPAAEFRGIDAQVTDPPGQVHVHDVAVAHQGDRAALRGFR